MKYKNKIYWFCIAAWTVTLIGCLILNNIIYLKTEMILAYIIMIMHFYKEIINE